MSTTDLQNDIAYMKALAEQGGQGPLRNGSNLFWAGLIYGVASVLQYAALEHYLPRTLVENGGIWIAATILFVIIAVIIGMKRRKDVGAVSSRAARSAWSGVGFGIFSFLASIIIMANLTHDFNTVSFLIAPVMLLLYGVGWWVSALMSGRKWLGWISFGCFLAAPGMTAMVGHVEQMLVYAACLFLFATVPGYILMRAEKV